jgi:hypothetical protein
LLAVDLEVRLAARRDGRGELPALVFDLIYGDKLIDLLIEHGIGVKKNRIEVLSVDADAFADLEPEA